MDDWFYKFRLIMYIILTILCIVGLSLLAYKHAQASFYASDIWNEDINENDAEYPLFENIIVIEREIFHKTISGEITWVRTNESHSTGYDYTTHFGKFEFFVCFECDYHVKAVLINRQYFKNIVEFKSKDVAEAVRHNTWMLRLQ